MSGEYAGHGRTGTFSASRNCVQILATWCRAYHAETCGWLHLQWASGSLCIHIANDKMQLCSLSVAQACTYHNPNTTMGHSVHNVDISKPFAHTMPYTLPAICPVQLKPGFIRKEHTSPVCQWPSKVNNIPLNAVTTPNCNQVMTLVRMQMSFPEKVSDSLCKNN